MRNRCLLGAGVALAVVLGGVQAHAQFGGLFGPYPPGVFYLGPEGGWTQLSSNTRSGSVTFRFAGVSQITTRSVMSCIGTMAVGCHAHPQHLDFNVLEYDRPGPFAGLHPVRRSVRVLCQ